ncbi:hypothetical protein T492DRAFT_582316, partial [Pavlovales sp. CCMP2436]
VLVVGGTGGTGSEVCFQAAMVRNEPVVALCRDPSKLMIPEGSGGAAAGSPLKNDKLTAVKGSVTSAADVAAAFDAAGPGGVTGVVIALGGKTADVGETMLRDGTAVIISEMKKRGGACHLLMMTAMKKIFKDKNAQEALFIAPGAPGAELEWTLVRPGGLTKDAPNGIINVIEGEAGSIARADVAAFCLDAVLQPDFKYLRRSPCISSEKGTSWQKDK